MKYLINLKNEFPLNHPDYTQQGFLFIDIKDNVFKIISNLAKPESLKRKIPIITGQENFNQKKNGPFCSKKINLDLLGGSAACGFVYR